MLYYFVITLWYEWPAVKFCSVKFVKRDHAPDLQTQFGLLYGKNIEHVKKCCWISTCGVEWSALSNRAWWEMGFGSVPSSIYETFLLFAVNSLLFNEYSVFQG